MTRRTFDGPLWPELDFTKLPPAVGVEQTCKTCGVVIGTSDESGVIPDVLHDCTTGEVTECGVDCGCELGQCPFVKTETGYATRSADPPEYGHWWGPHNLPESFTGSRDITYTWRSDWAQLVHDEVWAE